MALHQYVELQIPPYFKWSPSEWVALVASEAQPQTWTFQVRGRSFVMSRDSQPIFEGRIRPTPVGAARLVSLWCEGDEAIFQRGPYATEGDITDMFLGTARELIESSAR